MIGFPPTELGRVCLYGPPGPEAPPVLGILATREATDAVSGDRTRLENIARRNRIRASAIGTASADVWDAQYVADVEYLLHLAQRVAARSSRSRPVSFFRRLFHPQIP